MQKRNGEDKKGGRGRVPVPNATLKGKGTNGATLLVSPDLPPAASDGVAGAWTGALEAGRWRILGRWVVADQRQKGGILK